MTLSTFAIVLGIINAVPQVYGLAKPAAFKESMRRFPRCEPFGYLMMVLGTAWFIYNLSQENISDFAAYKNLMFIGFTAIGLGTCIFVRDFLAVRGLAIVMLLVAKHALDIQRWSDALVWKNVVTVWAYALVIAGIWFTISPWRMRDLIEWVTASESRIRANCTFQLLFSILLIVLGLTVYR